jgi:hypothetical protein
MKNQPCNDKKTVDLGTRTEVDLVCGEREGHRVWHSCAEVYTAHDGTLVHIIMRWPK